MSNINKLKKGFASVFAIILISLGVIAFSLFAWVTGSYNGLVTSKENVDTAWSQVETQYQRRYDMIPQLVGATKGTLAQEQEVFGKIAEARTHYDGAPNTQEKVAAANEIETALSRLLVIIENYPQLNSDGTIRILMDDIAGTENRISVARQRYNETTRDYNIQVKRFPTVFLANIFGYDEMPLFESEEGSEKAPEVDLSL